MFYDLSKLLLFLFILFQGPTKVYVALESGILLQFTQSDRRATAKSTSKRIPGYLDPCHLTLRTPSVTAMAMCQARRELWVGSGLAIDIVDCAYFKVHTDMRISLPDLLSLLGLPTDLTVSQIVCNDGQAFCLLESSPFVLEFCTQTHKCVSYYVVDGRSLYNRQVIKDVGSINCEDYIGVPCSPIGGRERNRSDTSEGSDHEEGDTSVESQDEPAPRRPPRPQSMYKPSGSASPTPPPRHIKPPAESDSPHVPPRPKPAVVSRDSARDRCSVPAVPPRRRFPTLPSRRPVRQQSPQTSFSLPSRNHDDDYEVTVTSIALVKDSLWVGRNVGDICVINTGSDSNHTAAIPRGTVAAVMYDLHNKTRTSKQVEHVSLLSLDTCMVSAYKQSDGLGSDVEIVAWENYGVGDIAQIEKFWTNISSLEKLMYSATSTQLQHLGNF